MTFDHDGSSQHATKEEHQAIDGSTKDTSSGKSNSLDKRALQSYDRILQHGKIS